MQKKALDAFKFTMAHVFNKQSLDRCIDLRICVYSALFLFEVVRSEIDANALILH